MTTKTAIKAITRQIRELTQHRKATLTGGHLPWGMAWCSGDERCHGPACEGCATVAWCRDQAAPIAEQIAALKAQLPGAHPAPFQPALF